MTITRPTPTQVADLGSTLGYDISEADAEQYSEVLASLLAGYDAAEQSEQAILEQPEEQREFWFPENGDNPDNAWYVKARISKTDVGPLAGRTVAVKDSILVAGVPMMNGASILEGFTPSNDATIVSRVLDAGAEVSGKTACEYFCLSGGSHTNAHGPTHNPVRRGYSAGGSSSGSAHVVATGEADLALGADQAGSIRMPASYSGIVGMKPTYGLVPYTGVAPIEPFFDHVGPMTKTVEDNALLLDIIAGPDGYDMRQKGVVKGDYLEALNQGLKGMRIGILAEGFQAPNAEADVNTAVLAAAEDLRKLGAEVIDLSLPQHMLGPALWTPIAINGLSELVLNGQGFGIGRDDWYPTDMMEFLFANGHRRNEFPPNVKAFTLLGQWVDQNAGKIPYAKAANGIRVLRSHYDRLLEQVDVLLMPATPIKAQALPAPDCSVTTYLQSATEMFANTCTFDVTHHPAISIPCGESDGLPIGVMLVGRHFDEATIYRIANAYETRDTRP